MNLSNGDQEYVPELLSNSLLLDTLIILMKDESMETRRNAAIALFNVACGSYENTVKLVMHKNGMILEVLKVNISAFDQDMDDPKNEKAANELQTNAVEALFNISCSYIEEATDRVANHPDLLEAIAMTLRDPSASRDVKIYCAATLQHMSEIMHAPKRNISICIAQFFGQSFQMDQNNMYRRDFFNTSQSFRK